MGTIVLVLGLVVVFVTALSQVAVLPGGDFAVIALLGLAVVVLGVLAVAVQRGTQRTMAAVGAVLGSVPIWLLVYFLSVSEG